MINYYISFGQVHVHSFNGMTLDKDILLCIKAHNYLDAIKIARTAFNNQYACIYKEEDINEELMKHFPRGIHYA